MCIANIALGADFAQAGSWRADWAWGLLLIFLTVTMHVGGLGVLHQKAIQRGLFSKRNRRFTGFRYVFALGAVTMLSTLLHVMEVMVWAASYRILNALPDLRSAMLYSLNAMTSYGHESLFLDRRWQLLGATEALNGWLLFGLTTAFLFAMFHRALMAAEGEIE
jgi:hypothetical protein